MFIKVDSKNSSEESSDNLTQKSSRSLSANALREPQSVTHPMMKNYVSKSISKLLINSF